MKLVIINPDNSRTTRDIRFGEACTALKVDMLVIESGHELRRLVTDPRAIEWAEAIVSLRFPPTQEKS